MSGKVVHGFYDSLRKTFFVLKLIGVFPITGLLNRNSKHSRCSWIAPYTVYHVMTTTSITVFFLVHLYDVVTTTREFKQYGILMLHCITSLALIFLVRLSFNWKNLMNKIDELERLLPPFKNGYLVVKTINRVIMFTTLFGLVVYFIYLILTVHAQYLCTKKRNEDMTVDKYFRLYFGWFGILPYSYATLIWLQIVKFQGIFVFCYIDVLIIAVTLYLIFRFRNFNRLMRMKVNKCNQNTKWCDVQAHYTRLTRLVKVVDEVINPFIFLSFLSSLMFSCKMIYDFIQEHKNYSSNSKNADCGIAIRFLYFIIFDDYLNVNNTDMFVIIYNICMVTFGLSRTLAVLVLTSHLHSLSREPLEALHTLPASAYNFQFQRLMDQVYRTRICLSGLQFFYVTRGTTLSMVSTIVTYELVLLQFPLIY